MTNEDRLIADLSALGIAHELIEHQAVFTVDESLVLHQTIPGAHTKNLFLKDKKGQIFLVTARESARIDLKRLHETIGASGRLSFGNAEQLMAHLGVTPGSVTALSVINDKDGLVTVVLDAALMGESLINCHPLINTATTTLPREGLLAFLNATGHTPLIVNLPGQPKSIAETLEGLPSSQPPVPGIFAAVPYCIDLIGGPYLECDPALCKAFRPKSAQRPGAPAST